MAQYQRNVKVGTRWWFKFTFQGETYHSKAIFLTKNEAKKAEAEKLREVGQLAQNPSQKPILSLREVINERLDILEVKKSSKYYKDNKRYLKILYNHFGNVPIDTLKKTEIEKVLLIKSEDLQEQGKDNYAVNAMIRCYKALFNHALKSDDDLDFRNPVNNIDFYSIHEQLKYIPPDEEIQTVINHCDQGQQQLIEFVKETACRISEALRVTGKDIKDNSVILYTRKSKNSNLVPRRVPLDMSFVNIKPDEKLFPRWSDNPKFLEKKIEELGFNGWGWHNLRHRRASLWSKEGKPIFEIMSLLGHSNMSTTQKYLQLL